MAQNLKKSARQPFSSLAIRTVLGAASVLLATACSNTASKNGMAHWRFTAAGELDHSALNPIRVTSTQFAASQIFGKLGPMALSPGYLWVGDYAGDPFLYLLDRHTGALVRALGRRGAGPGDFRGLLGVLSGHNNVDDVWAFDPTLERLTNMRVNSTGTDVVAVLQLPTSPSPRRIARFGSGFIAWSDSPTARFVRLDSAAKIVATAGGPFVGPDSVPEVERMKASSNLSLCAKPDGSKFAVAYFSAGRLETHDSSGSLNVVADVPFPSVGEFAKNAKGDIKWTRLHTYYAGCVATDATIIALFAGQDDRPMADGSPKRTTNGARYLHVFDWSGRLLGVFELDQKLKAISLDAEEQTLWGAGEASALYRFDFRQMMTMLRQSGK